MVGAGLAGLMAASTRRQRQEGQVPSRPGAGSAGGPLAEARRRDADVGGQWLGPTQDKVAAQPTSSA